jgi:cell division protein FtsL
MKKFNNTEIKCLVVAALELISIGLFAAATKYEINEINKLENMINDEALKIAEAVKKSDLY